MGYSNGKIYAPVSHADVQAVLGVSYTDNEKLCRATEIHKWSKFKPVAHTIDFGSGTKSALTEIEAKGADSEITSGIIYGLRVGTGVNNWADLHNSDYEYVGRPNGSPYPDRLMDFAGYDHYAKPTLLGSIVNSDINLQSINLRVGILWQDTNNTTGVDILQMVGGSGNVNSWYVNVLVGTYAITLINVSTGTRTPIVYNGTKQNTFYINSLPSGYNTPQTVKCTFFLSPVQLTSWTNIANSTQQGSALALPDAAGLTINIVQGTVNYGTWAIGNVTSTTANAISVPLDCSVAPGAARDYRVVLQFSGQAQAAVKTFSITASTSAALASRVIRWSASELGFTPTAQGTYTYNVILYGYNSTTGTNQSLATKSGTLTLYAV